MFFFKLRIIFNNRLIEKFETTANTDDARSQTTGPSRVVIIDEKILKVEKFFQENPTTSIRRAAQILNIIQNFCKRLELCQESDGSCFEHIYL